MTATASWGLAPRLLAATLAVVLVAAATAWAVAVAIGPGIFHDHMVASGTHDPAVLLHAERAFRDASVLSITLALCAALVAAVAVSLFQTKRVARSLASATAAARRVAVGEYDAVVPSDGLGREFSEMAEAFNMMARDLGAVESSRTRMLGDLAHEMRTPIATLDAYLEAIIDGVNEPDDETLALLRAQVARLARLGEDVALVTTAEEGGLTMRRAPLRVSRIVDDASSHAAARYAERGVQLDVRVTDPAGASVVDADADRLGQVFTNLLDNASRHTPAGGRVEVVADRDGDSVRIRVTDTGEGIAPEHLSHVFERFYRVDTARDRAHGGSGVGLAIVQAIVRAHGGSVTAASDGTGRGATFTVTLPLDRSVAGGASG